MNNRLVWLVAKEDIFKGNISLDSSKLLLFMLLVFHLRLS